jgi:hypothetical protein
MSMSVGASSNALSYLQSLLAQGTAGAGITTSVGNPLSELLQTLTGSSPAADPSSSAPPPPSSAAGSSFGADTMAALISMQGQSTTGVTAQSPSQLFAKIDTNGDGQISKSEFEGALSGLGVDSSTADSAFAKLDTNDDGSISQSELASARPAHGSHGHHAHGGGVHGGQSADASSSSGTDGTTTQSTTNPDGSTTTTITYADGSSVEMTTPAVAQNGGGTSDTGTGSQNNANLLEKLIQLQAQLVSAAGSTLSALV